MDTTMSAGNASLRWPLVAIGSVVVLSIGLTAAVRWSGRTITEPDAPVWMTRALQFEDRADGGIDVLDAATHRRIETVTGQAGFVRGTLRGLARERRRAGVGPSLPFELVAHTDGRVTLMDPSTARRVDLESFGPTNLASFAHLLVDAPPATHASSASPAFAQGK